MVHCKTSWLLAGVMSLGLGLGLLPARAADTPPSPATQALNHESLGKILSDMGYEPKKISDTTYEVVVKRDGWSVYFRICFSNDKTKVWLISTLANIKDVNQVPAEPLAKLLMANNDHGPSAFYLAKVDDKNKAAKVLKIGRPVDNRGLTASLLRIEIDTLFSTIKETKELWSASGWKTVKSTTVSPTTDAEGRTK
jgi:hypothetical protein